MNESKINLTKAAIGVGFGFYFGKRLADIAGTVVETTVEHIVKNLAEKDNELAKSICAKAGIKYETDDESQKKK